MRGNSVNVSLVDPVRRKRPYNRLLTCLDSDRFQTVREIIVRYERKYTGYSNSVKHRTVCYYLRIAEKQGLAVIERSNRKVLCKRRQQE